MMIGSCVHDRLGGVRGACYRWQGGFLVSCSCIYLSVYTCMRTLAVVRCVVHDVVLQVR